MYKFFLLLLAFFLFGAGVEAQQMQWVPGNQVTDPNYKDGTDCSENIICYALAYTPAKSGQLTSYTTNFLLDCDSGKSAVIGNRSLVMSDNSAQEEACAEAGLILLLSSGNTGMVKVRADRAAYLHEICIQTSSKRTSIQFSVDNVGALTTSLDVKGGPAVTERPSFQPFLFKRSTSICPDTPDNIFDVNQDGVGADIRDQVDFLDFRMSPNPASDDVQVRFTHPAEQVDFYLLDASGREIRTWLELNGEVHTISVSDLPAGIYHLNAQTTNESITKKLVVRR